MLAVVRTRCKPDLVRTKMDELVLIEKLERHFGAALWVPYRSVSSFGMTGPRVAEYRL